MSMSVSRTAASASETGQSPQGRPQQIVTVAIVAIGAALQLLGLDLIDYVRTQLGI